MPHVPIPGCMVLVIASTLAWGGVRATAAAAEQGARVPVSTALRAGATGAAANTPAQTAPDQRGAAGALVATVLPNDRTAAETRSQFEKLLENYPPTLARILKLDPSLMGNPAYLAPYPGLAAFLAEHPDVALNATYFLANTPDAGYSYRPPTREQEVIRLWRDLTQGMAIFLVVATILGTLCWLVRTFLDYRRWLRLSKVQVDVHTKLLDRLTANEDLLNYIQTPAGRHFLEALPIPIEPMGSPMSSPVRRVLWAVQTGIVLAAGGVGLSVLSWTSVPEVTEALNVIGVLALSLGVGFVLSAAVSFLLSKRLGLFERPGLGRDGRFPAEGA